MSEWQPIETAPKDHTDFLAFEPRFGCVVLNFGEYANDGHPLWEDRVQEYWPNYQPTHWMPLPSPPAKVA
jgi:hypothetical protein